MKTITSLKRILEKLPKIKLPFPKAPQPKLRPVYIPVKPSNRFMGDRFPASTR